MQAIVYTEFGPPEVLHLAEVPTPAPAASEVAIRVHATPVNYGDLMARDFKAVSTRAFNMPAALLLPTRMHFGFSKPKVNILGSEFAGEIAAIGSDVTRFKPGDRVMGYLGQRMGAYAEVVCMPEDGSLTLMPVNMSFVEAAAVPYGAIMATSLLARAKLRPGHKVLINGASGGIGSAAVQLAKVDGAEVTGVCGTPRLDYVRALGADHVIDYSQEDFTRRGETYDVIFDILGRSSFSKCRRVLAPDGIYLLASFKTLPLLQMGWTKLTGRQKVICALANERTENLALVADLIEAGKYKSIVDRSFPMDQAADAHRYAESGNKTGNVVITTGVNGPDS